MGVGVCVCMWVGRAGGCGLRMWLWVCGCMWVGRADGCVLCMYSYVVNVAKVKACPRYWWSGGIGDLWCFVVLCSLVGWVGF